MRRCGGEAANSPPHPLTSSPLSKWRVDRPEGKQVHSCQSFGAIGRPFPFPTKKWGTGGFLLWEEIEAIRGVYRLTSRR